MVAVSIHGLIVFADGGAVLIFTHQRLDRRHERSGYEDEIEVQCPDDIEERIDPW
jgi:hypothetical protein